MLSKCVKKACVFVWTAVFGLFTLSAVMPMKTYALTQEQEAFIENIGNAAMKNYSIYKILPSMTTAQAILESGWGKSSLSKLYYNFFGMKAGSNYSGETVTLKTGEEVNGVLITVNGTFRVYHSFEEGIEGYYQFITGYPRYSNLIGETDYKTACTKIREDGWATDSSYTKKLINLIETYNLTRFDDNPPPPPDREYFPACARSHTSIVDALISVGAESSYAYRSQIAAANGISGYSGTADQNTEMLNKLKKGVLKVPNGTPVTTTTVTTPVITTTPSTDGKYYQACASSYGSIVDALISIGVDSSMDNRKLIAAKNGISGYSGTADQNIQMLDLLKAGKLIRTDWVEPPTIVNYTVSLDANGGTSPAASITVASNSSYSGLPTASREGYSFDGWYTTKDGGSKAADGVALASASDHTLYAHWKANTYKVTLVNNDGDAGSSEKEVTFGAAYGELVTPSRTGYAFTGWYNDINGGVQISADSVYSIADNQTLYAHWKANTYKVSYDLNGGSGSIAAKTVEYDGVYGASETPEREGYSFVGWFTAKEDGTMITPETIVSVTKDQVLYAHWEKDAEVIELMLEETSVELKNGDQYTIKANQSDLTYKSNNSAVAVVSKTGVVTAVGEGKAIISVINSKSDVVQLKVTVTAAAAKTALAGDVNGDEAVNLKDVVLIRRYIAGGWGVELDESTADVNKDGAVNLKDVVLIRRYIAGGWGVEL